MPSTLSDQLRCNLEPFSGKPAIVHSDLLEAAGFVEPAPTRTERLQRHVQLLESTGARILIPAFTYRFLKDRSVDLRSAPSEVGALSEHARRCWASHRTSDPVFSHLAQEETGKLAPDEGLFVAFGESTDFADVVRADGAIVMYGAPLASLTILHRAELVAGGPPYRYDKDFAGSVISWNGVERQVTYRYHVRPMGRKLEYDWPRIDGWLSSRGILRPLLQDGRRAGFVMPAREAVECLAAEMRSAPLALLDLESRAWVEPMLDRLGRRFELADFEP